MNNKKNIIIFTVIYSIFVFAQLLASLYFSYLSITSETNKQAIPYLLVAAVFGISCLRSGNWLLPIMMRFFDKTSKNETST